MEKNRSSKILAVLAVVLSVVGLSLGFAAFTNTLNIKSQAGVTPNSDTFNVDFSTVDNQVTAGTVTPTSSTASGSDATIDNAGAPTISGLKANFTAPGQSVVYDFYAFNDGQYDAFLNSIAYENAQGGNEFRKCVNGGGTQALVDAACKNINVTVSVGGVTTSGSKGTINEHKLLKNDGESVQVKIDYTGDAVADGPFSVEFGDIVLTYNSAD